MKLFNFLVTIWMVSFVNDVSSYTPKTCDIRLWHMQLMENLYGQIVELTARQLSTLEKVEQMMELIQSRDGSPLVSCSLLSTYSHILVPDAGKEIMEWVISNTVEMVDKVALSGLKEQSREPEKDSVRLGVDDEPQPQDEDSEKSYDNDGDDDKNMRVETEDGEFDEEEELYQGDSSTEDHMPLVDGAFSRDDDDDDDFDTEHHEDNDSVLNKDEERDDNEVREDTRRGERDVEENEDDDDEEIYVLDAYGNFAGENVRDTGASKEDVIDKEDGRNLDEREIGDISQVASSLDRDNDGGITIFYEEDDDSDDNDINDTLNESKENNNDAKDVRASFQEDYDNTVALDNIGHGEHAETVLEDDIDQTRIADISHVTHDDAGEKAHDDPQNVHADTVNQHSRSRAEIDGVKIYFEDEEDDDTLNDDERKVSDEDETVVKYGRRSTADNTQGNGVSKESVSVDLKLSDSMQIQISTLYTTHCVGGYNQIDHQLAVCDNMCSYFYILLYECDMSDSRVSVGPDGTLPSEKNTDVDIGTVNMHENVDKFTTENIRQFYSNGDHKSDETEDHIYDKNHIQKENYVKRMRHEMKERGHSDISLEHSKPSAAKETVKRTENERRIIHLHEESSTAHDSRRSGVDSKTMKFMLSNHESEQAAKIQSLELMIVKLENRILTQGMEKQSDSTSVVSLENHILKLENELLKLNQSYHKLKQDHDALSSSHEQLHSSYLETNQVRPKYLPIADKSSKELMTQQQVRLTELQRMLQNQSEIVHKLQSRSDYLEDENRKLFQTVMNQSALIFHVMSKMQEMSEDGMRMKFQAEKLKAQLENLKQTHLFPDSDDDADKQTDQILAGQPVDMSNYAVDSSVKETPSYVSKDLVSSILLTLKRLPFADLPPLQRTNTWWCSGLSQMRLCLLHTLVISNCIPFNDIHWKSCKAVIGSPIMDTEIKYNQPTAISNSDVPKAGQDPTVSLEDSSSHVMSQVNRFHEKKKRSDEIGTPSKHGGAPTLYADKDEIDLSVPNAGERKTSSEDKLFPATETEIPQRNDNLQHVSEKEELQHISPNSSPHLQSSKTDFHSIHSKKSDGSESNSGSNALKQRSKGRYYNINIHEGKPVLTTGSHKDSMHINNGPVNERIQGGMRLVELVNEGNIANHDSSTTPEKAQTIKVPTTDRVSAGTIPSCIPDDGASRCGEISRTGIPSAREVAADSPANNSENNLEQLGRSSKADHEKTKGLAPEEMVGSTVKGNPKETRDDDILKETRKDGFNQPNNKLNHDTDIPNYTARQIKDKSEAKTDGEHDYKFKQSSGVEKDGADIPRVVAGHEKTDDVKPKMSNRETKERTNAAEEARALHEALHRKVLYEPLHSNRPKDCYDLYKFGQKRSGLSQIYVSGLDVYVSVYCGMENGGWTVLLKREDGHLDFYRNYEQYKEGFGAPRGEHYIGNEVIHYLTNQGHYSLRAELSDWEGNTRYAHYDHFWIDGEDDGFQLHISGYSGNAGDGLSKHSGMQFSTYDIDHDLLQKEMGGSCAKRFHGAGWFFKCYASNLMGRYYTGGDVPDKRFDGVAWKPWRGNAYSLKTAVLAVRPRGVERLPE